MGWNFLRHTIKQMTDMERARQELYEKYIDNPDDWIKGLRNAPEYLVRRLQRAEEAKRARKQREEEEARLEEQRQLQEQQEAMRRARSAKQRAKSALHGHLLHRERWR